MRSIFWRCVVMLMSFATVNPTIANDVPKLVEGARLPRVSGFPNVLAWHPDNRHVMMDSYSSTLGRIRILDAASGTYLEQSGEAIGLIHQSAWTPDGRVLAVLSSGGFYGIRLLAFPELTEIGRYPFLSDGVRKVLSPCGSDELIAFSQDGRSLWVACRSSNAKSDTGIAAFQLSVPSLQVMSVASAGLPEADNPGVRISARMQAFCMAPGGQIRLVSLVTVFHDRWVIGSNGAKANAPDRNYYVRTVDLHTQQATFTPQILLNNFANERGPWRFTVSADCAHAAVRFAQTPGPNWRAQRNGMAVDLPDTRSIELIRLPSGEQRTIVRDEDVGDKRIGAGEISFHPVRPEIYATFTNFDLDLGAVAVIPLPHGTERTGIKHVSLGALGKLAVSPDGRQLIINRTRSFDLHLITIEP